MFEKFAAELQALVEAAIAALAPAAFGAAVAAVYEKGLRWTERLFQWAVGSIVAYYVTLGLGAWFGLSGPACSSVSFVIGLIAFRATPLFIASASSAVGSLPAWLRDRFIKGGSDDRL
jgi:hypothetical protein